MADKLKKEDISFNREQSSVKLKEFTLKKPLENKKAGDKVRLGSKGESFYKSKNII